MIVRNEGNGLIVKEREEVENKRKGKKVMKVKEKDEEKI